MVEFEYCPWKKVVIHDVEFEELEKRLMWVEIAAPPGSLAKPPFRWCKGWIITSRSMEICRESIRERMKGILRLQFLGLSPLPDYVSVIELENRTKIPVIDVSDSPFWKALVQWALKTFEKDALKVIRKLDHQDQIAILGFIPKSWEKRTDESGSP